MAKDRRQYIYRTTASLLLCCFLFQPVIVYFATPQLKNNASSGSDIVACTLKYEMMNQLADDSSLAQQLAEQEYCPAIKLLDMAHAVIHRYGPVYGTVRPVHVFEQTKKHVNVTVFAKAYTIRAPPAFS